MYAILNVVYGVSWEAGRRATAALDEASEDGIEGLEVPYNGGGDGWGYFGVDVHGFDECSVTKISELPTVVTKAMQDDYQRLFDALDPSLQAAVKALGEPELIIVPSSS